VFLSCSADWTINLYHLYNKDPWASIKVLNEDFAVNDISWCPGNSTVFASVNSNGKLFIWDLTESSIDPVATVDTNSDEQVISYIAALKGETGEKKEEDVDPSSTPATPAIMTRYDRNKKEDEKQEPPVTKLINSLTNGSIKRELTCVRFGLTSPCIAVGDNIGTISIYRVIDPVTIVHEGPLQQLQRLKAVLTKNLDPSQLEALAKSDTK
jgi:WD40 repeat protein